MAADTTAPLDKVLIPEPNLLDAIICDHQHALALFDHFTLAAAQGNIHVMEVLAGAIALDLRLHLQAESDCLHPSLGDSLANHEAQSSARNSQALEGSILEMLTYRREQKWAKLIAVVQKAHQEFAGHVHGIESQILPLLPQTASQAELTALARKYHHVKKAASLLPQVGAILTEAASGDADGLMKESFPDRIDLPESQQPEF
ncbi:hypothetical protein N2152v2_003373 [Parachlorella kessleri]